MLDNIMNVLETWGPRVLYAALILVVAYIIALIVKWAIGKAIDELGFAKKANENAPAGSKSVGAQLASAGFWLTMLIGIVQASRTLGATVISDALDNIINPITAYLPNVVGAALIFGIFAILANVVKIAFKAIFAPTDALPEKFGIAEGPTNISGIMSIVGSSILMIVGTIQALDTLKMEAISDPVNGVLNSILTAIPKILFAALILTAFVFVARLVSKLAKSTLPGFGVDEAVANLGVLKGADGGMTASGVIASLSTFFITLLGLISAVNVLGIDTLTSAFNEVLSMGASIAFGAVIIFAGAFIANMVAGAMKSAGGEATDAAADVMKWAIIIFTTILGISRMGLDPTGGTFILNVAQYVVIGAAAAGALAFGWGGKDWAAAQLERFKSTK